MHAWLHVCVSLCVRAWVLLHVYVWVHKMCVVYVCVYNMFVCVYYVHGWHTCVYACVYVHICGVCIYTGVCLCEFTGWVAYYSVSDPFGEIRTCCRRLGFMLAINPKHRRFEDRLMGWSRDSYWFMQWRLDGESVTNYIISYECLFLCNSLFTIASRYSYS